jgi:hypothetical protein
MSGVVAAAAELQQQQVEKMMIQPQRARSAAATGER